MCFPRAKPCGVIAEHFWGFLGLFIPASMPTVYTLVVSVVFKVRWKEALQISPMT